MNVYITLACLSSNVHNSYVVPRKSSRALGLQWQDPGEELQAGRVDTPTRLDDERHEVRLVAVRIRILVFVERCRLAWDYVGAFDAHVQDPGGPTLDHLDVATPLVSRGSPSVTIGSRTERRGQGVADPVVSATHPPPPPRT